MKRRNPRQIVDSSDETVRIAVSRLGRKIYLYDEIDRHTVLEVVKYIDELEKESKKPVEIEINSEGGLCYDGMALYDRIRRSDCEINTIATGLVGSMALVIYLAGDYRYITENCKILNHEGSDELEGKASALKIGIEETLNLEEQLVSIIAERTGLPEKKIKAEIKKGDDYIKPDRAIEEGFAHELIPNKRTRRRRRRIQK